MHYLLLLYGDEERERALSDAERRAIVDEHIAFATRLREAGAHVSGEALTAPEQGKVMRWDGEDPVVTDGPFAETKEQLGGFYVLECEGIEGALRWAEQVPKGPGLVIEIRPIASV
jgi:hypothetical protein